MRTSPNGSFLHSRTLRSSEPHDSRMKVTRGTCVFSGAGALGTLPSDSHSFIFSPGCGALLPVHAMGYGLRAAAGPGSPPGFPDVPGSCTPAPAAPQHLAVPQTGLQFLAAPVSLFFLRPGGPSLCCRQGCTHSPGRVFSIRPHKACSVLRTCESLGRLV